MAEISVHAPWMLQKMAMLAERQSLTCRHCCEHFAWSHRWQRASSRETSKSLPEPQSSAWKGDKAEAHTLRPSLSLSGLLSIGEVTFRKKWHRTAAVTIQGSCSSSHTKMWAIYQLVSFICLWRWQQAFRLPSKHFLEKQDMHMRLHIINALPSFELHGWDQMTHLRGPSGSVSNLLKRGAMRVGYSVMKIMDTPKTKTQRYKAT